MKTKTITIRLELPASQDELLRGLHNLSDDADFAAAERALARANADLDAAKERLRALDAEARGLPDAIKRGTAGASQLDAIRADVRRASSVVATAEQTVAQAERERDAARLHAMDRALRLVDQRFAELLKADVQVVRQMNAIDSMMDVMTVRLRALCGGKIGSKYDQVGRTGEQPDRAQGFIQRANVELARANGTLR
jgi:hypothetical protein